MSWLGMAKTPKEKNPMREARIEKVTINIGCGAKHPTDLAKKLLESLTKKKVVITKGKKRSLFGVPKGKPIGAKITLRKGCEAMLKRLLDAKDFKLPIESFDSTGNFSFGIKEYIDVPGLEYDPKMPMFGFDVAVTLTRPGYSIKARRVPSKIGKRHLLSPADAMAFAKEKLGVKVVEKEKE
jgi:large subunit ribosomal protein L5